MLRFFVFEMVESKVNIPLFDVFLAYEFIYIA